MKKSFVSFVALSVAISAFASASSVAAPRSNGESISQVAQSVQAKQALVNGLQERIARHERMSLEEIAAELESGIAARRQQVVESGQMDIAKFDQLAAAGLEQIKALGDKDAIIAMETAQLQQVMSSENIVYGLTRAAFFEGYHSIRPFSECRPYGEAAGCAFQVVASPFVAMIFVMVVAADTVLLPFELIGSALTGF